MPVIQFQKKGRIKRTAKYIDKKIFIIKIHIIFQS